MRGPMTLAKATHLFSVTPAPRDLVFLHMDPVTHVGSLYTVTFSGADVAMDFSQAGQGLAVVAFRPTFNREEGKELATSWWPSTNTEKATAPAPCTSPAC